MIPCRIPTAFLDYDIDHSAGIVVYVKSEMLDWCADNLKAGWEPSIIKKTYDYCDEWIGTMAVADDEDAILFRLRWQ